MTDAPAYAAIDLGASSGRVVCGRLDEERVVLEECARFANRPVRLPDGLHWNLLHLFAEALDGLRRAGPLAGVGVDTWGIDYALLDGAGVRVEASADDPPALRAEVDGGVVSQGGRPRPAG